MSRTSTLADLSPAGGPAAPAIAPPQGRRLRAMVLPGLVVASAALLLLLTAGQALRPHTGVQVAAVIVRGTPIVMEGAAEGRGEGSPAGREAGRAAAAGNGPPTSGAPGVVAAGWLEAEPYVTAATALTPGVIAAVHALEGDTVRADQVIAELVDDEAALALARAEAMLAQRRAARASARAELEAAEAAFAEPVDLERRVQMAAARLAEAQAALAQHPALVEIERLNVTQLEEEAARQQRAQETRAASEIELIRAERLAASARAQFEAVTAEAPLLEARVQAARAELRAAERTLDLRIDDTRRRSQAAAMLALAEAQEREAEAMRDDAALRVTRMTIRAPQDGIVQRRLRKPGDIVGPHMDDPHGAHIMYLYDPARLQARVDVPLADARHVRVGGAVEIVAEVLPQRTFRGTVLRVTHEADLQKNTLQVKVRLDDPDPLLRPEMLVRARFGAQSGRVAARPESSHSGEDARSEAASGEGLFVPPHAAAAVREGRVLVVDARRGHRGVARQRVCVLDPPGSDGWHRVRSGLQPGDLIIVAADGDIREGRRVRITSMEEGIVR